MKKRKELLADARARFRDAARARLRERGVILSMQPEPRYDEVFEQGTRCLDELAGPSLEDVSGVRLLYEIPHLFLALLWTPFQIVAQVGRWMHLLAGKAGDALVRPLYWAILTAKRRHLGEPPWKPIDWQIGIGPPCDNCKKYIPPERHRTDCPFVLPAPQHLSMEQIEEIANVAPERRTLALQAYAIALRADGVDLGSGAIDLGNLLRAAVEDVRRVSKQIDHPVLWREAARACREIAREIEHEVAR